jgi:hypothetical protein
MRMTKSLTFYDEVFRKTRNLFKRYQKISKRIKENPSRGLSSIFVGSCAKKPTKLVLELFVSEARIKPSIRYRNMVFIGDLD